MDDGQSGYCEHRSQRTYESLHNYARNGDRYAGSCRRNVKLSDSHVYGDCNTDINQLEHQYANVYVNEYEFSINFDVWNRDWFFLGVS